MFVCANVYVYIYIYMFVGFRVKGVIVGRTGAHPDCVHFGARTSALKSNTFEGQARNAEII